jgi:hypothetical protein
VRRGVRGQVYEVTVHLSGSINAEHTGQVVNRNSGREVML